MSKKMLIDATHSEETRVVVLENGRVEELDVDTSTKKQIKGNIYLARIVRVEPSLQAAFVDYGGNKHGFLAFGEIHPDYYQIPVADREALKELMQDREEEDPVAEKEENETATNEVEVISESEAEETPRQRSYFYKRYKIQEVIRQGQVMLVQVVKEERGNKGAALTTYLSLAGRYSVLMPNNGKGGGVSRKITNVKDRKTLRTIVDKLPLPEGMSVIIRTAGQGKTKTEIKRDFDYLIKTWLKIRENTLESLAPKLIHEEGDIIKRSLRDVFSPDIDEIWVEGESVFKSTKDFMKMLMPGQAKKVKQYKGTESLFFTHQVENQLEAIHSNVVQLKSGGYLVIDQTEALVAVDVNSGRATREHDIEETALRTNLETCDELARQLRLRDMAGLIVIDFIDMDEAKNNAAVERRLKEALKRDRARIQVGKMSGFGLMEMSRQRLHSSFLESSYRICPHCGGKGMTRSVESCAMHALHILEDAATRAQGCEIILSLPLTVAAYILNTKRHNLVNLENRYTVVINVQADATLEKMSDYKLERIRADGEKVQFSLNGVNPTLTKPIEKEKTKKGNENKKAEKAKPAPVEQVELEIYEEEPEQISSGEAETNENSGNSHKSRNSRRRQEWRKKRRERRLMRAMQAQQEAENNKVVEHSEENFTVVEQQALEDFNATQDVGFSDDKTEEHLKRRENKTKHKKPRSFKSRHAAKMQRAQEESSKAEILMDSIEIKMDSEHKKTKKAEKSAEHSEHMDTAQSVEFTEQKLTPEEPKKKKRGWWNKLVNTTE
ncbi:MAG: Rne/Rng family ribonuclease [Alphaproteobacteria bacterium]|nr:Rne/Rng family ribonuclease [Alphaproteobacteria bacterium]